MDLPRSLPHALLARAAALGARPACGRAEAGRRPVGWDDLEHLTETFGRGLIGRGMKRGDRVALLGEATPEWVAATLGAMGAGGVVAPLVNDWPRESLAAALEAADPTFLVVGDDAAFARVRPLCGGLAKLRAVVQIAPGDNGEGRVAFEQIAERGARVARARWHGAMEHLIPGADALLGFTLGTLGAPRAVSHTHEFLLGLAARFGRAAGLGADECLCSLLPSGCAPDLLLRLPVALLLGARVDPGGEPTSLLERLREVRPTLLAAGPRALEALATELLRRARRGAADPRVLAWARHRLLARHTAQASHGGPPLTVRAEARVARALVQRPLLAREGLERLRRVYGVGGPVRRRVCEALAGLDLEPLALYGLADAGGAIAVQRPGERGPRPLPGVEVRADHDGRLEVRCPAAATSAARWVETGDWADIGDDGTLRLRGRHADRIYAADGTAIAPSLVEGALQDEPLIGQAVVFGEGRRHLGALVSLAPGAARSFAQRLGLQDELEQIASHPAMHAALGRALARASRRLQLGVPIARFRVLPRPLSSAAGELNAFGQPRRARVAANWSAEIEALWTA